MPKPKTTLDLKREADAKINKARTALKKYHATPEGQAYVARCKEYSDQCRAEWMHLERERRAIKALPVNPRLIVTGGRNWCEQRDIKGDEIKTLDEALDERRALGWVLDAIAPAVIIHGGARGADRWVGIWAAKRGVPCVVIEAQWDKFGHQAGPERNQRMIDLCAPSAGCVFPGGGGTADCHARMLKVELPVYVAKLLAADKDTDQSARPQTAKASDRDNS